ncbi:RIO1 family regulatory kinase/ATPase [Nocardioides sp. CCNWLW239]|uniref:serine protein kinase RIO n=1 Tax=Nocardioides sp. CCNWLW239 TaxID=3128902 RepID=UPI003019E6B6
MTQENLSADSAVSDSLAGIDPNFIFDFQAYDDDLDDGQRWSTWLSVEPLSRGPEPRPDWVVTSQGAIDTELGVLKTGKEADAFLIVRADPLFPEQEALMVAKRYRDSDHRTFHRAASYTEGRSVKRSRDERALKKNSTFGREVAKAEWANAEWNALVRCWNLGLPVPYPVQIDGTEILMEWIAVDDGNGELETAPRLAQTRPERHVLEMWWDGLVDSLATMVQAGMVHGDLSPYNILAQQDRLVIIDLPQIIDLVGNPLGFDFLLRDIANVAKWFQARGLEVDEQEVYADLMAHAF